MGSTNQRCMQRKAIPKLPRMHLPWVHRACWETLHQPLPGRAGQTHSCRPPSLDPSIQFAAIML